MRIILACLSLILLAGCGSGGGGGGGGAPAGGEGAMGGGDNKIGTYYQAVAKSNGDEYWIALNIEPGNIVNYLEIFYPGGNHTHGYYRKNNGTYKKSGDDYSVTWSYETCNPVGTDTAKITGSDPSDRIVMTVDGTSIAMLNTNKWEPAVDVNSFVALTEDTACDKFPAE